MVSSAVSALSLLKLAEVKLRLRSDEDLFKNSTMSFGEHLEELRGALFRAIAGLAMALIIAFPFADNCVRVIEGPLMRGLEKHYRHMATDDMLETSSGTELFSEAYLIHEQTLTPRRVRIDRAALRAGVQNESTMADPFLVVDAEQLAALPSVEVARRLVEASNEERDSLEKAIWLAMPVAARQRLKSVLPGSSETDLTADAVRQAVAAALTECLTSESLAKKGIRTARWNELPDYVQPVRERLRRGLSNPAQPMLPEEREPSAASFGTSQVVRQLNRMLLSATFPEAIPLPVPDTVEITIWEPGRARIQTLGVPEAFLVWVKAWLVLAVILASPWIFFQLWMFVAAGLYGHERKLVYTFLPISIGLFLAGAALAFCFVFDPVLDFLFQFNRRLEIDIEPRFSDWIGFVLLLPLGFGISFQLPLVMLAIERFGIVTPESYIKRWRIAVLIIFVMSMLLTPADPISMLLMALPLTGLYFGGILLCRFVPQGQPAQPVGRDP